MQTTAILYPVFALVILTFFVVCRVGSLRIAAASRGEADFRSFKLNDGQLPARPVQAANNLANLSELPVLFYALVALLLVTDSVTTAQLWLAWVFVASRFVHSGIHLTYNHVPHRFLAFLAGVASLLAMWVVFAVQVAG